MMKNFNKNEFLESQGQRFTYSEIVKITNNFASIIGRGGFGKVYLGTLKNETQVAVKLLGSSRQGSNEFRNEVDICKWVTSYLPLDPESTDVNIYTHVAYKIAGYTFNECSS